MQVDVFIPCSVDRFSPQTGFNMLNFLLQHDIDAKYFPSQSCCGQCFFNDGFWEKAKMMGENFLQTFKGKNKIICPTSSCANFIKRSYKELFHNTALHLEYKSMEDRILDFTDFAINHMNINMINSDFEGKVAYFHSCSAQKYGLRHEPIDLLKKVKGVELLSIKNSDECCGFGGKFALHYEPVSVALARDKVQEALDMGANYITSTDTTCLLFLDSYIKKEKLALRCIHVIDIVTGKIHE